MTIGERIKQARKTKGLTQKQLGEMSGTSETTVKQYELGKRQPRIEQLQALATALNVPMFYLLGDTDDPNDKSKTHWAEIVDFSDQTLGERLVNAFMELNLTGQEEAVKRVEELICVPYYQRIGASQPPSALKERDTTPTSDGSEGSPDSE